MSETTVDHRAVIDRFVQACRADPRVAAATIYGSRASSMEDEHSDLDLAVITTDEAYQEFAARRAAFVALLGEPLFIEDFDIADMVFAILSGSVEVEIKLGCESKFQPSQGGPYRVLLDKRGILADVAAVPRSAEPAEQVETLRRLIAWFWHDLSHFITAMARGQLWWAQGQLSVVRQTCINLARLQHNFSDPDVDEEGFFKVDQVLPPDALTPLESTFCPLERDALLDAADTVLGFYRELARPLAETYGVEYPAALDRIMTDRLHTLSADRRDRP